MRISVTVEVYSRQLPGLNLSKRRPEKSYLSIGYVNKQKDKIYILHQTIKNYLGVKYKIYNNVSSIFDKFLSEGKATIRFIEPPVDLIIKGETNKIKNFLQIVKTALKKDGSCTLPNLSNLHAAPTKVVSEPTVRLIIKKKTDLPNFPRNLEHLEISQSYLTKFDTRILRLQKLRVLNLEDNGLEDIPSQIELLPVLEELHLAKNRIGKKSNFSWLRSSSLRTSLTHLDLRENHLSIVPTVICRLKNLKTLLLDKNMFKRLPPAIGCLPKLKNLSVSYNKLEWMPGSVRQLQLQVLDVSNNAWESTDRKRTTRHSSLLNLAATAVLRYRLEFCEETLPRTLNDYLESAGYCFCGLPFFPESPSNFLRIERFLRGAVFTKEMGENPLIAFTSCMQRKDKSTPFCFGHVGSY